MAPNGRVTLFFPRKQKRADGHLAGAHTKKLGIENMNKKSTPVFQRTQTH